jgi:ABC-type multidrug transport system fused ATPase/permease subunit
MADGIPDDIRRRLENLENAVSEVKALMRENVMTNARHNELIIDLKEAGKEREKEMADIDDNYTRLNVEVSNLKLGFGAVKWVAGSVLGTAIVMILGYLFKGVVA